MPHFDIKLPTVSAIAASIALMTGAVMAQPMLSEVAKRGYEAAVSSTRSTTDRKTFTLAAHEIPGDGKGTTISNIVVTIEQGETPYSVVYSLDYDWYNHGEGDKPGSSNTILLLDFLGAGGYPLPSPSITSTDFRHTCTYPAQHRHEVGRLSVSLSDFVAQARALRARDTGIAGYAGGC